MKGDEFWSCDIGSADTGTYKLDYSGAHATLWAKHGDKSYSLLIPSEIMDRLALVWQQWRKMDNYNEPTKPSQPTPGADTGA
jgi:hypothetical protein